MRVLGLVCCVAVGGLAYYVVTVAILSDEYGGIESTAGVALFFGFLPTLLVTGWTGWRLGSLASSTNDRTEGAAAAVLAFLAAFVAVVVVAKAVPEYEDGPLPTEWLGVFVLAPVAAAAATVGLVRVTARQSRQARTATLLGVAAAVVAAGVAVDRATREERDPARTDHRLDAYACPAAVMSDSVWVPNCISTGFTELDAQSLAEIDRRPWTAGPLAAVAAFDRVWAVYVRELDAAPYAQYGVVSFDPSADDAPEDLDLRSGELVSVAAGAGSIWVTDVDEHALIELDPSGADPPTWIPLTVAPAYSSDGIVVGLGAAWIATDESVQRYELKQSRVTDVIEVWRGAHGLAIGGGDVWATDSWSGTLLRIDPTRRRTTETISVCESPTGVEYLAGFVWIACYGPNEVVAVDARTGRIARRVVVGDSPDSITAGTGALWVTYADGRDADLVTRIDVAKALRSTEPER